MFKTNPCFKAETTVYVGIIAFKQSLPLINVSYNNCVWGNVTDRGRQRQELFNKQLQAVLIGLIHLHAVNGLLA